MCQVLLTISLYNLMFRYALKHEIVDKDYATLCNSVKKGEPERSRKPFPKKKYSFSGTTLTFLL